MPDGARRLSEFGRAEAANPPGVVKSENPLPVGGYRYLNDFGQIGRNPLGEVPVRHLGRYRYLNDFGQIGQNPLGGVPVPEKIMLGAGESTGT